MELISATDIGIRREENQDNYWCARLDVLGREVGVVCVCDGMGGLSDGGLASRIVVQAVREFFKTSIDSTGLIEVLKDTNKEIYDRGIKSGRKMGTTCTILICDDGKFKVLHVGDSRCYVIMDKEVRILTTDHSVVKQYGITMESRPDLYRKYRSSLTRCMGAKPDVTIDVIEGKYINGDKFIVCSDGFWHYLDRRGKFNDIDDLRKVISECIDNGETDNITAGVLKV